MIWAKEISGGFGHREKTREDTGRKAEAGKGRGGKVGSGAALSRSRGGRGRREVWGRRSGGPNGGSKRGMGPLEGGGGFARIGSYQGVFEDFVLI